MYKEDLSTIISESYERLLIGDDFITVSLLLTGLQVNEAVHVDRTRLSVNRSMISSLKQFQRKKEFLKKEDFVELIEDALATCDKAMIKGVVALVKLQPGVGDNKEK